MTDRPRPDQVLDLPRSMNKTSLNEGTLDQIVEYPAHWLPPNRAYWCQYLADWVSVKKKWGLAMDSKEADVIGKGRNVCKKYKSGDGLKGRH